MEKNKFLLPPGFRDLLPNEAEQEYFCVNSLLESFFEKGYRLVSTPLLESADSLFEGGGAALEPRTLKLIDPLSQKVLGLRADITVQVSRLVRSRMADAELPIKLCYAGDIVRSYALNTRGQRQLKQVGVEYIENTRSEKADAEIALLAMESLNSLGIENLSIDINTPNLLGDLVKNPDEELQKAIQKRDLENLPPEIAELVQISGKAEKAFKAIEKVKLSKAAKAQVDYCRKVYELIIAKNKKLNISVDFVETRGFEYHDTFSFSIFARDLRDEIGRGGRYKINGKNATGFTVYVNPFAEKVKFSKN